MAMSTASNWFWNFMLAFFTPFIVGDIDFRYGYVFAACNAVAGFVVFFFVMEGKGRTLEEINEMYVEKVVPWKSSAWEVPSIEAFGERSRSLAAEANVRRKSKAGGSGMQSDLPQETGGKEVTAV